MNAYTGGGIFATSRRGGVDMDYLTDLRRKHPRASMQTLANMSGYHIDRVRAALDVPCAPLAAVKIDPISARGVARGVRVPAVEAAKMSEMMSYVRKATSVYFLKPWNAIMRPITKTHATRHERACAVLAARGFGIPYVMICNSAGVSSKTVSDIDKDKPQEAHEIDKLAIMRIAREFKERDERAASIL